MFVTSSACFNLLWSVCLSVLLLACFGLNCSFFGYYTEVVVLLSLTFSDEVVTAAQHLYEMVSFYFDDLGKLLLDEVLTLLSRLPRGVY